MSDEYEEADFDEEDFQEAPEATGLRKYDEIVFCPHDGAYMPFRTHGAIVRRHCGTCGRYYEGSLEVSPEEVASLAAAEAAQSVTAPKKTAAAAKARAAVEAERPAKGKTAPKKKAARSKAEAPAKKATDKPAKAKKTTPAKKTAGAPTKAKKKAPAKKAASKAKKSAPAKKTGSRSTKAKKSAAGSKTKKGTGSSGKKAKTATKRADTKRNTKTARPAVQTAAPDRCAALTASGTPCRNAPRGRSKYCASHRGWRPPRA